MWHGRFYDKTYFQGRGEAPTKEDRTYIVRQRDYHLRYSTDLFY